MTVVIRPTEPHEHRAAQGAMAIPLLHQPLSDEDWNRSAPSWDEMISFSAWEDDVCLGHAGQFPVDTVVPGGALLSTGAVSRVGVMPTARRRGIGKDLMHALIRDSSDRGQVLMSLRASEATIYGRFGFGVAGDIASGTVDPARARPVSGVGAGGSVRLLDPTSIIDAVRPLYERAMRRTVGAISRPASWTQRYSRSAIERSSASFVVVHTDADGVDDGYAQYELRWNDPARGEPIGTGRGHVDDLWATNDAAELALWAYLLDIDLATTWTFDARPTDDLIRSALADRRAHRITEIVDEQWLRLIDVDAALRARSYRAVAGAVTVGITDPLLEQNVGTWRLSADGAERTDAPADISTDIVALSRTYLGGVSWSEVVGAGAASGSRPEAVTIADALMGSDRAPFCGSFF